MLEIDRLAAIEEIRRLKARYWRGVDSADSELVRDTLAEHCVLDFVGCCTDPVTGFDHMPAANVVKNGRESWTKSTLPDPRPVTVHQGYQHEITIMSSSAASAIWSFSDRFFVPGNAPSACLGGYGFYHDTYEKSGGVWLLKTLRITRLRMSGRLPS